MKLHIIMLAGMAKCCSPAELGPNLTTESINPGPSDLLIPTELSGLVVEEYVLIGL